MKQTLKASFGYAAAMLWLLLTEICIGIYGLGIVRSYVGDVLVVGLLYCLIRIFTKALPKTLPLWLFGVGCLAELLQLCRLSDLLGFERGSLPSILIGTSASWWDVVSYAIGAALIYAAMYLLKKLSALKTVPRRIIAVCASIAIVIGSGIWWVNMAIDYRFDYDVEWMMGRTLDSVQDRYIRYDAQMHKLTELEAQGYVYIGSDGYFYDAISSAGNLYHIYYAKCDERNIVTDVVVIDSAAIA